MTDTPSSDSLAAQATQILSDLEEGDPTKAAELLPLVYDQLRQLARHRLSNQPGQTLQATALVHEAYVRVVGNEDPGWDSRSHFFAAAAEAMRRILVDSARRKQRVKHGGGHQRLDFDEAAIPIDVPLERVLAVDEALDALSQVDERAGLVVNLHYFAGLTLDETAEYVGISPRSAHRNWAYARAWLYDRLGEDRSE